MTVLINEESEQIINIVQNGRYLEFNKRNSPIMYKLDLSTKNLFRMRKQTEERVGATYAETTRWFKAQIRTEDDKIEQMFLYSQAVQNTEEPAEIIRGFRNDYMDVFEKWASLGFHLRHRIAFNNAGFEPIEIEPGEMPAELRRYASQKTWENREFKNFCNIVNYTKNGRYREPIKKIFAEITNNTEYEDCFIGSGINYLYNDDTLHLLGELIDKYNMEVERLLIYLNYLNQVEYINISVFLPQYQEYLEREYWKHNGRRNKMYKFPKYFDSVYAITMRKEERIRRLEEYDPDEYENSYLEYHDDDFIMRIPRCAADVEREGELGHCIATHFMDYIARGDTAVVFMRKAEEPDTPFITIEVRDNRIRQACIGDNNRVPSEYRPWIRNWAEIKNIDIDDESWETRLAFN